MTQDYTMEIAPDYPYGEQGEEKGSAAEGQGEKEGEGANAEQQQQSEHPQEGGQQQGQPNQDQNIPLHVLQAIRQENQQLKAEVDRIKQQQTQQPQGGDDDDPYKGYDPDDVVTVADIKKIMSKQSPQKGQEQGQGQQGQPAWTPQDIPIMENQIRQKHTDYDNTIQQLPNLTNQYPHLLEDIKRSSNPPLTAYAYVKHLLGDQQHQSQGGQGGNKQMAGDADKALKNLERPGSAGKVSGQSAISQTGYFAGMSDEELEQHMAKVKRGS